MNDLRQKAADHIQYVDQLRRQLAELEEFQEALLSNGGSDIEIGIWKSNGGPYHVWLEKDLGITSIQDEFKKKLITELHIRKEVLEMTLTQLIGGNEGSE